MDKTIKYTFLLEGVYILFGCGIFFIWYQGLLFSRMSNFMLKIDKPVGTEKFILVMVLT